MIVDRFFDLTKNYMRDYQLERSLLVLMNKVRWPLLLAITFIVASVTVYCLQIVFFHRAEDTLFYLFQDLAFLPINALLVVLILDRLLKWHEKQSVLKKMNIVIGVFFSEMGIRLLATFSSFDKTGHGIWKDLVIGDSWSDKDYESVRKNIKKIDFAVDAGHGNLQEMHDFFVPQRSFVLSLMENPHLLEHESFTDMLLAVSHLMEELSMRKNLASLSVKDQQHISIDIRRAFSALVIEWLGYMHHLKKEYPYLYSLAVRTNPFNPEARAEIN